MIEFSIAEADSKDNAKKDVANQLTKPEQLERLDQYKRKVARKKATIESQLRNAVQTQLDGIQKGLGSLQTAEKVVKEIKDSMNAVEQLYQQCADLSEVVRPIKDVNRRHQQLTTTTQHIHNIFNVPQVVKETQELIEQGRLLEAHRNLAELEHTRDELLIQLYQSEDAFVDKNTSLHHYFEPLTGISDALGQQLWMIMHQTPNLVANDPKKVVTALRIIEREERTDTLVEEALKEKNIPTSQLPGRPKRWRDKCKEILETSITNKFESLKPDDQERIENKGWLNEHLTAVAGLCYTDLQAMKNSGHKCFPESYDIVKMFITRYHDCLVDVISGLVKMGLNARDIIVLMIWIGDVRDSFNETLGIDFNQYGPLIDPEIEDELQTTCQEQVEGNVKELVSKMVETEREDWDSTQPPEADVEGKYYTSVGITLYQMIEQNISALSPLGLRNKLKVLGICLDAVMDFQRRFLEMVDDYYRKHIQSQRREPPFFVHYMIAAANNCRSCIEFAEQLKKQFLVELNENTMDPEYEVAFKKIAEKFDEIGHKCCNFLMDTVMMDLAPVLQGLFHKEAWFGNPEVLIGKIEGTLLDYNEDFSCLKQAYHSYIVVEAQHRVMQSYMQAMMEKRMVFKKEKDREKAARMIREEAKKMSTVFLRLSHASNPKFSQVLEQLAELLNSKQEYLVLDISAMANKHPDIKANHVLAVLAMRGDLNKGLATKIMQQCMLPEQQGDGGASGGDSEKKISSSAMKKKQEEKNLLAQLTVPNPYSLFGK